MTVIDVHNHVVPETFPVDPSGGATPAWPCMECGAGHSTMVIAGENYRKFDERSWSAEVRRDYMDEKGIDLQVLSPLPELLSYWLEPAVTAEMAKYVNGSISSMLAFDPGRFQGLGMVPLQEPAAGAAMLAELKGTEGFRGVQIGSNINGRSPFAAEFDEFWAAAHELEMAVFVHGIRPAGAERLVGPKVMAAIVGIPTDTALCVSSCISSGVLERYPGLNIGFSHGGGAIGSIIDRFEHVWKLMPDLQEAGVSGPRQALSKLYFDIMTFNADYVRFMLELAGEDQLFIGSDFPAGGMGLMDPLAFIDEIGLEGEVRAKVCGHNARRYLRL